MVHININVPYLILAGYERCAAAWLSAPPSRPH
jgi:hypothetical protein